MVSCGGIIMDHNQHKQLPNNAKMPKIMKVVPFPK
jgi:hypothetical protein